MFSLNSILTSCVLVHGHDETDLGVMSQLWPFNDDGPTLGGDPFNFNDVQTTDDEPQLGQRPPHTGELGEPCDGNWCNGNLHCKISWHDQGSYSTSTCVREQQAAGGRNERCRTVQEGSPCDPGLVCERVRFYPSGWRNLCREPDHHPAHPGQEGQRCRTVQEGSPCEPGLRCQRVRLLPSGHRDVCQKVEPHNQGEANQRCNDAPLHPCNHNNLRPHYTQMYPSGHTCTCVLNLQGTQNSDSKLGASGPDSDTQLGMPAPQMGGPYQPCRNGQAFPWTKCDAGCYCQNWHEGTATMGTCLPGSNPPTPPAPKPHMGREGEPCRSQSSWQSPCDSGLFCQYYYDRSARYGVCTRSAPSPSPSPSPSNCGGQGQKCCGSNLSGYTCHGGLTPVPTWEHQFATALSVPRCSCQQMLGAGLEDEDDQTLGLSGVATPAMGGLDQPCKNGNKCDDGLYCKHWTEGTSKHGACKKIPENHGGPGQPCYPAPMRPCKKGKGLTPTQQAGGKCKCEIMLGDGLGDGADEDGAKLGSFPIIEDDQDSPQLGMASPQMGGYLEPCRNGNHWPWTECDSGLYCQHYYGGQATYGTCLYDAPAPPPSHDCGQEGGRCCSSYPRCLGQAFPVQSHHGMGCQCRAPNPPPSHLCGQTGSRCCGSFPRCFGSSEPVNNHHGCTCQPRLYMAGSAPSGGN